MPMIIVIEGCKTFASVGGAVLESVTKYGLFQNNFVPTIKTVLADLVPCDFSGYTGLVSPIGWTTPVWDGVQAVVYGPGLIWTHNGGPVANDVYGYYAVLGTTPLMLIELFADGPRHLALAGDTVQIVPPFTFRSRF